MSNFENADYVTGLEKAWPTPNDSISFGDDHIRQLKNVLLNTFPEADEPQAKVINPDTAGNTIHAVDTGNGPRWAENDKVQMDASGNVLCESLEARGDVLAKSDDRLKTRIGEVCDALEKIKTLDAFTYRPNETGLKGGMADKEYAGVSAQQVREAFPEAVSTVADKWLAVDYGRLTVLLIAAVKELAEMVESNR